MTHVSTATELAAASGLSTHVDAVMAAEQVCESVAAGLNTDGESAKRRYTGRLDDAQQS